MSTPVCRSCRAELVDVFADLGTTPLSNSFLKSEQLNKMEPFYPLRAFVCAKCFLVQLEEFETPSNIFREYAYFSSYSDTWLEHARKYAALSIDRFKLDANSHVIEVASNDGYLLQYFRDAGIPVTGVEPAANVARVAQERGIPTITQFLGKVTAATVVAQRGKAKLVVANNVLAHVPNLNDFIAGLEVLLEPDGVLTLEFPHVMRLIGSSQFDTIYHEHFSYFSLLAASAALERHGLSVFDVEELPTHGGSLRVYASRRVCASKLRTARPNELVSHERSFGLENMATYTAFNEQAKSVKRALLRFLIDVREQGKSIVAYGAPAKGNTLLNYCGIRTDLIDYTVDRNPYKQNLYLPGTRIPIYSPERISDTRPDFIVILPWNIRDEIARHISYVRAWGGKLVVPIPRPEILS